MSLKCKLTSTYQGVSMRWEKQTYSSLAILFPEVSFKSLSLCYGKIKGFGQFSQHTTSDLGTDSNLRSASSILPLLLGERTLPYTFSLAARVVWSRLQRCSSVQLCSHIHSSIYRVPTVSGTVLNTINNINKLVMVTFMCQLDWAPGCLD